MVGEASVTASHCHAGRGLVCTSDDGNFPRVTAATRTHTRDNTGECPEQSPPYSLQTHRVPGFDGTTPEKTSGFLLVMGRFNKCESTSVSAAHLTF